MIFDIDKALTITPEMKRFFDAGANIKSNHNNNNNETSAIFAIGNIIRTTTNKQHLALSQVRSKLRPNKKKKNPFAICANHYG